MRAPISADPAADPLPPGPTAEPGEPKRRRRSRAEIGAIVIPLLFFFGALAFLGYDLERPDGIVFDEIHYLKAARNITSGVWIDPAWPDVRQTNWEHPPVGKYWIALAIELGDEKPEIYRIPSVLHGALGVAALSLLASRVFRDPRAGLVAPLLLMADPMWYVWSRMATLDIFVAGPMVLSLALAFGNRKWEPYAAGAAAGYALAAKYTAFFLLPALFVILLVRYLRRPDLAGGKHRLGLAVLKNAGIALALPFAIFFVSYAPFLYEFAKLEGIDYMFSHWLFLFGDSLRWAGLGPQDHPEATAALQWLPMTRPTWLWITWGEGATSKTQIMHTMWAIGNPVVWWGGVVFALAAITGPIVRLVAGLAAFHPKEDWSIRVAASDGRVLSTMGVAFFIFAVAYAPFFVLARVTFLYYMVFLVPYLALMAGGGVAMLWSRGMATKEVDVGPPPEALPLETTDVPVRRAPWMIRARVQLAQPWVAPAVGGLFVVAALALFVYWIPLFTTIGFERQVVDRAWELVPWMERALGPAT